MSYYERVYDEDGNPEGSVYVKEEPDCGTCCDNGYVVAFPPGGGEQREENCPDCNPTDEQVAAQRAAHERYEAEFRAAVERGEASWDDPPF